MAKKKFDIGSTLSKNKKQSIELAKKIPLKKTAKNPEEIKIKVEEIHADELKVDKKEVAPKRKVKSTSMESKPKATQKAKQRLVRMTIDTPEDIHLQLKIKSIQAKMSMRDYVLKLIDKELKKG